MKQLLALVLCVATLTPSTALAAGDEVSPDGRLILSGKQAEEVIINVIRSRSRYSSQQQASNEETWLGMHPALTISLFTAGIGAVIGAYQMVPNETEAHPSPTSGERARGALIGAGVVTGLFWLAALVHR